MDLLNVEQLAQKTGESVSTWRKRLALRVIPVVKLGTNVRVRQQDLERWIDERRVEPSETACQSPR